jgi:hypothetical protein
MRSGSWFTMSASVALPVTCVRKWFRTKSAFVGWPRFGAQLKSAAVSNEYGVSHAYENSSRYQG